MEGVSRASWISRPATQPDARHRVSWPMPEDQRADSDYTRVNFIWSLYAHASDRTFGRVGAEGSAVGLVRAW
jgi:hypothetical protein